MPPIQQNFKQKHPLVTQQLPWKITIIELSGPTSIAKSFEGRSEWGFLKFEVPSFTIQPYKSMYIHIHPHQSRYPYSNYQSVVSPSVSNVQSRQFRMLFGVSVQLCQGHCGCLASHFPRFEGKTPDFRCFNQVVFPQTVWPHLGFLR